MSGNSTSAPRCVHCGQPLTHINAPCPNCLPGFDRYPPYAPVGAGDGCGTRVVNVAALDAEIKRLRAENARLQEALRPFAEIDLTYADESGEIPDDYSILEAPWWTVKAASVRAARAALSGSGEGE